jgi:hypothetical protein
MSKVVALHPPAAGDLAASTYECSGSLSFCPLRVSPSLPIGARWLSQKKVPEYKIVFAGGDGAAARGASNPAISYLQPRLSSNDLIERVAIWTIEMNLWTRHDTSLPALGGSPGAAIPERPRAPAPTDGQRTKLGMAMSPTVRAPLG